MKKSVILLLLLSGLVLSCGTAPNPPETSSEVEDEPAVQEVVVHVEAPVETKPEPPEEVVFDPHSISEAVFQDTKRDITEFITELNGIIRARNYNAWLAHLSPSYFDEVNTRGFLDAKTEELYRRDLILAQNLGRDPKTVEKRILKTTRDYFELVVVPSRASDRVDDISFLSDNRVRAYTVDERRGVRLVLYDLAYINNKWLIAE